MRAKCPLCRGENTMVLEWMGEADEKHPHDGMRIFCMRCKEFVETEILGRRVRILAGD